MNIEEERKAMEEYFLNGYKKFESTGDRDLDIWLAAKAHAAEMAKPELTIEETVSGKLGLFAKSAFAQFATEAEAVQWAKDNGYRVIEE